MQIGNITPTNPVNFLTPLGPREINEIPLDVVVEEQIEHTVEVTDHPIEVASGSGILSGTISDNAFLRPTRYVMRGAVSDLPISWRVFESTSLTTFANFTASTRSLSAYQILLSHLRNLLPFTLITPFGELQNMLFVRLSSPRRVNNKSSVILDAEFREIQTVVPLTIQQAASADSVIGDQAADQAVPEVERGSLTLEPL